MPVSEIAVINDANNPEPVRDIFAAMGLPVFSENPPGEWTDASELTEPEEINVAPFPVIQPGLYIPKHFILFNELASVPERCVVSENYYRTIKRLTGLPVVKVGRGRSMCPCDIDLTNEMKLPEVAWLAKNAVCVVSSLTFHRVWARLFGTPVIEVCETSRVSEPTIGQTMKEYREQQYGLFADDRSRWLRMPEEQEEFDRLLQLHAKRQLISQSVALGGNEVKGMSGYWDVHSSTSTTSLQNKITSANDFAPDMEMLNGVGLDKSKPLKILDFGAGMLRNTYGLLQTSPNWHVTAYDTAVMLERGAAYYKLEGEKRLTLSNKWPEIASQQFDLIFCSLVLQHIEKEPLSALVQDFKGMTKRLFVIGRRSLDDYLHDVWSEILPFWKPTRISREGQIWGVEVLLGGHPEDHHAVMFE